jgi:hypothetical protein
MCDYSLAILPNRLAVEGEELIVYQFHTGSKGLAPPLDLRMAQQPLPPAPQKGFWEWLKGVFEGSPGRPNPNVTAVCVPPGAQLLLKGIPEDLQRQWRVEQEEGVFFLQTSATENTYRDAIQFRHGHRVLLQNLREGMLVQILSLGSVEVSDDRDRLARPFKPVDHFV